MQLVLTEVTQEFRDGQEVRRVLDDISATFVPGELTAITGPSGVGKSTLLSVAGFLRVPTRGEAQFCGGGNVGIPLTDRHRVTWIFQTTNLLLNRSVVDNVAIASMVFGSARAPALASARQALRQVGLYCLADSPVSQLSGGERQRVAVARAIARPSLLILADEPTAQLDSVNAANVVAALRTAASRHVVIVASHDPMIADAADRVLGLHQGKLVPL